ncbi:MAG TPA: nuclear transport factor 2 family protein [Nitrospira sp.]|nr:nuclear transport factor 2 family protein [Nitrospira sp.]
MGVQRPEDLHSSFSTAFNQGNLETLIALYEWEAVLIPQPGQVVQGHEAIRASLQQFLSSKGTMELNTVFVIRGGTTTLLRGRWKLSGVGADGRPFEMRGESIEVARRQANGEWLFSIDHPFGAD